MKINTIGQSDMKVPAICLGTMNWGQQNTEADAHAQLDYAVNERGITFIDTAEIYPIPPDMELQGLTEIYLGNWLAKNGNRDKLIIATKVSPAPMLRTREVDAQPKLDSANIRAAVEGSLERLQTDYIDLYQIHWPVRQTNFFGPRAYPYGNEDNGSTEIKETLEALKELIEEGKIKYIGVSNETAWGVSEYLRLAREHDLPRIVSIQNQYSLLNRTFEIGISEFCMRENISLLPYSALNMGILTGKYLDGARPEGARFSLTDRNKNRYDPDTDHGQDAVRAYVDLAKKHGLDPAEMAIAYTLTKPFVASTIIGATKLDQLKTCIDAGETELSDALLAEVEEQYKKYPDVTA